MNKRFEYLLLQADEKGIKPPLQRTLDKYGLLQEEWLELLAAQGWVCAICKRDKLQFNTDHEHVAGWVKMPDEERKRYVRGVLCWHCNHKRVHSRLSSEEAYTIYLYIKAYEERRDAT